MFESLRVWQRDERLGLSSWQEQNVDQSAVLGLTQEPTLPLVRCCSNSTIEVCLTKC
jgi:hypothetical protein